MHKNKTAVGCNMHLKFVGVDVPKIWTNVNKTNLDNKCAIEPLKSEVFTKGVDRYRMKTIIVNIVNNDPKPQIHKNMITNGLFSASV